MGLKVLLVDCLTAGIGTRKFTRDFIGSGPRYIAGYLEDISNHGIEVDLVRSDQILEGENLQLENFPIIALSAMTMDLPVSKKIISRWLKYHPNPNQRLSILGGPITCDADSIRRIPVDVLIPNEAEIPLKTLFGTYLEEIISNISLDKSSKRDSQINSWKNTLFDKIPDILYLNEGKSDIVRTRASNSQELQEVFFNTSGYPEKIKSYSDFEFSRIYVECLRGCSNYRRTALQLESKSQCSDHPCSVCREDDFTTRSECPLNIPPGCGFCSTISQFGGVKSRKISLIVQEIQTLIQFGAKRIVLGGSDILDFYREKLSNGALINPCLPEPNYPALEKLIHQLLQIPEIVHHEVQIFVENVKASLCTDRALDILSQLPSAIFSIGCETGSSQFANILGRPGDPKVTLDAVQRAMERGIRIHVYFIHSLPGDTAEFAEETLKLIKDFARLQVDKITLYRYQELPGSPFWNISNRFKVPSKKLSQTYKKIKRHIIQYNKEQKGRMLGRTFKVFLTEINRTHPKDAMGWILEGGPKVSVIEGADLLETYQTVRILQVLSDRLVLGQIISK